MARRHTVPTPWHAVSHTAPHHVTHRGNMGKVAQRPENFKMIWNLVVVWHGVPTSFHMPWRAQGPCHAVTNFGCFVVAWHGPSTPGTLWCEVWHDIGTRRHTMTRFQIMLSQVWWWLAYLHFVADLISELTYRKNGARLECLTYYGINTSTLTNIYIIKTSLAWTVLKKYPNEYGNWNIWHHKK